MSFQKRIFLGIFSVSLLTCLLVAGTVYLAVSRQETKNYYNRYEALSEIIAGTFQQLEAVSEATSRNALHALDKVIEISGEVPADSDLDTFAKRMGVNAFYVVGRDGHFVRSSDYPVEKQTNSIFSYCESYRGLIDGSSSVQQTPVIPGWPHDIPTKFTMVPSSSKQFILEAGVNLQYLSEVLERALHSDGNVRALGLYTPNGYELGSITAAGDFRQGRRGALHDTVLGSQTEDGLHIISMRVPAGTTECCECKSKGVVDGEGEYYEILKMSVTLAPLVAQLAHLRSLFYLVLASTMVLSLGIAALVSRGLVSRLSRISATADAIVESGDLDLKVDVGRQKDEIARLAIAFNRMLCSLRDSQKQLVEAAKLRSIAKLASQVAHDIRSPIAALVTVSKFAVTLPEQHRKLVRDATRRIDDIANNLLSQHRGDTSGGDNSQPELLATLVHSVMSEQRARYVERDVELKVEIQDEARGLFASLNANSFKRALANLTNNAVEALSDTGTVAVELSKSKNHAKIVVSDTGCGIPEEKIAAVLAGGATSKEGGNGIGLSSAKQQVEAWGGDLLLESTVGSGTRITLLIPRCAHAEWFAPDIRLTTNSLVVVLDDDDFIGTLWAQRFPPSVEIRQFRRCLDFLDFFFENRDVISTCLIDYEFVDDKRTGIDLITQLNIADTSFLVTSHDEDQDVRDRCASLGLRIIPKSCASYIPIHVLGPDPIFLALRPNTWSSQKEPLSRNRSNI